MTSARYFTECKVNKKSSALLRAHNPQHSSPSAPWQFVKKQEPVHIGNYENLGCMFSNDMVPLIHVCCLHIALQTFFAQTSTLGVTASPLIYGNHQIVSGDWGSECPREAPECSA